MQTMQLAVIDLCPANTCNYNYFVCKNMTVKKMKQSM